MDFDLAARSIVVAVHEGFWGQGSYEWTGGLSAAVL